MNQQPPAPPSSFCPSCGQAATGPGNFCQSCGKPLSSAPSVSVQGDERTWAMFCHLSALLFGLVGLSFLGPLLILLIKGKESPLIDDQAKEALNFQISVYIYCIALAVLSVPLGLITMGLGTVLIAPLFGLLGLFALVVVVMGAVSSNKGEYYRYPLSIRLVT